MCVCVIHRGQSSHVTPHEEYFWLTPAQLAARREKHARSQRNVVFIKPTKVGGTTINGILRRFALKKGINGYSFPMIQESVNKGAVCVRGYWW
jgi:hypothetical protein